MVTLVITPVFQMEPSQLSTSEPHPRISVLIVDDRARVRFDLHFLLELSGRVQVVAEAAGGPEALEKAAMHHPDVVIMDLELPGMDGCQVTRLLKEQENPPRVIFFSIYAGTDDVQRARQAGADAYIQKGRPIEELLEQILAKKT